jgi:hypothetical protein
VADGDLTFQDDLSWPVDDTGQKLDDELLPETPGEAARRRIDSVLAILDEWDDWITSMGGDVDATGRKKLSKIRRMKCHLRSALKGVEILR